MPLLEVLPMSRVRTRAAVAAATTVLLAVGGTAVLTSQSASAAPTEDNPVASLLAGLMPQENKPPVPDGNSPGTGGDAYKPGDPFVDNGEKPTNIPAGTIVAKSFQLFPATLKVSPGQEITLDNQDVATHNIQTLEGKVKVKSPDAEQHQKVTFKAPTKAAKYEVGCYYHQSMIMTIVVK
jgi:plastocyanin